VIVTVELTWAKSDVEKLRALAERIDRAAGPMLAALDAVSLRAA
jgi:hypothetical protein